MCLDGISKCANAALAHPRYHAIAHKDYDRALNRARQNRVRRSISGQSSQLIPFNDVWATLQLMETQKLGVQTVEIDTIVGSSGRYRDFDLTFLPRRRVGDDRWVNIAQAHYEGIPLPPVLLYKLEDAYYVEDGNHRVSVARLLGHDAVQAQVVELISS